MNHEHREGSSEQALAFFSEQIGTAELSEAVKTLLTNVYNFAMDGKRVPRVLQAVVLKNGKKLYLTGEIR